MSESCERGVDVALSARFHDLELYLLRAGRFLHTSDHSLGIPIVRVYKQGERAGLRNQLGKQFQPLGCQFNGKHTDSREVTSGSGESSDQPVRNRVGTNHENNRNCRG